MIGKIFIGIIALFLLIGPFSTPISNGIKTWRTNNTTESKVVATAAGITSANVSLGHDLYQAATGEVISVSSNITETPIANSYTEKPPVLLVSALNPNTSRTLTINYYAETDDTVMRVLGPFLPFLIFGSCAGAIIFSIWMGMGKRR